MYSRRLSVELVLKIGFTLHRCTDNIGNRFTFENATQGIIKCFGEIITFHISCWFIDNLADVSGFESIGYIKVSNVDVFGSFTVGFPSIPF